MKLTQNILPGSYSLITTQKSPNEYVGPMNRVAEIGQNEFGLTVATDQKPVLTTYGLTVCVSIAGYEPERKIGFLTHYQYNTDLDVAFGTLLYYILKITHGNNARFQTRIRGGISGMSEDLVDGILRKLEAKLNPKISFRIIEKDVLTHEIKIRDSVVDTTNGKFYDVYDPLKNPDRQEPLPEVYKELIFQSRVPLLGYLPKEFE